MRFFTSGCPSRATRATFFAELCNSITRQPIELERCSNPVRIRQVFSLDLKNIYFVLGFGFSVRDVTRGACFRFLGQVYLTPGANPTSQFFGSSFFGN